MDIFVGGFPLGDLDEGDQFLPTHAQGYINDLARSRVIGTSELNSNYRTRLVKLSTF